MEIHGLKCTGLCSLLWEFLSWRREEEAEARGRTVALGGAGGGNRGVFRSQLHHQERKDAAESTPSPSGTSGPATGSCGNCVFPFMYGSRIHESCTTIDGSSTPWCSTTYEYQGSTETCSESCPGASVASTPQMYVHPSNAVNSCCKYSSTRYKYLFALIAPFNI